MTQSKWFQNQFDEGLKGDLRVVVDGIAGNAEAIEKFVAAGNREGAESPAKELLKNLKKLERIAQRFIK